MAVHVTCEIEEDPLNQRTNGPEKRSPDILGQARNKICFKMAQSFLRKATFNFQMQMTLGQGQEMPLTFNTHISSLSQLVSGHRLQKFWKINSFHFFL